VYIPVKIATDYDTNLSLKMSKMTVGLSSKIDPNSTVEPKQRMTVTALIAAFYTAYSQELRFLESPHPSPLRGERGDKSRNPCPF
jgi:hypothetical protein